MSHYLSIKRAWKSYGDKVVLENINLQLDQGEFVTLVGANNCGKSTFLRILLAAEAFSQGEVACKGRAYPDKPDVSRILVNEQDGLFPHLTVLQNVLFGFEASGNAILGRLYGQPKKIALTRSRSMLDQVGLAAKENCYPYQLTTAEKQKLALAQAMVLEPEMLLLDEPFRYLTDSDKDEMQKLVLSLWAETHVTIFMAAHSLQEGFALGTRILVFDKPRVDPQEPDRFGATITFDLPIAKSDSHPLQSEVIAAVALTENKHKALNLTK